MYPYALSSTAIKDASRPGFRVGEVVWKRQPMALHHRPDLAADVVHAHPQKSDWPVPGLGLGRSRSARATTSAVSRVGGAVWLRVTVEKSELRTLTVTVRANSCRQIEPARGVSGHLP